MARLYTFLRDNTIQDRSFVVFIKIQINKGICSPDHITDLIEHTPDNDIVLFIIGWGRINPFEFEDRILDRGDTSFKSASWSDVVWMFILRDKTSTVSTRRFIGTMHIPFCLISTIMFLILLRFDNARVNRIQRISAGLIEVICPPVAFTKRNMALLFYQELGLKPDRIHGIDPFPITGKSLLRLRDTNRLTNTRQGNNQGYNYKDVAHSFCDWRMQDRVFRTSRLCYRQRKIKRCPRPDRTFRPHRATMP